MFEYEPNHCLVEGPLRGVVVFPPGQGVRQDVPDSRYVVGNQVDPVLPAPGPQVQCQVAQGGGLSSTLLVDVGHRSGVVRKDIHSSVPYLRQKMLQSQPYCLQFEPVDVVLGPSPRPLTWDHPVS